MDEFEFEGENGILTRIVVPDDVWFVTDLTEVCQYVGEQTSTVEQASTQSKQKCTKEEIQKIKNTNPRYEGYLCYK